MLMLFVSFYCLLFSIMYLHCYVFVFVITGGIGGEGGIFISTTR